MLYGAYLLADLLRMENCRRRLYNDTGRWEWVTSAYRMVPGAAVSVVTGINYHWIAYTIKVVEKKQNKQDTFQARREAKSATMVRYSGKKFMLTIENEMK